MLANSSLINKQEYSSSGSGNHGMGSDAHNPASATTYGLKDPVYINARMLSRLGECYAEGRDPRTVFATYDLDGTGLIDAWRFREVLQRLQLLSLEAHVEAACVDFIKSNLSSTYSSFLNL